jgi:cytochrome c-type biogenesis protein CcmF
MPPDSALHIPHSPMAALGTLTLLVTFVVCAYAGAASLVGQRQGRPRLVTSGLYASWAFTALITLASSLMVYLFLSHDFRVKYVAHYSDSTMPLFYKITAYWGGLDGSLMFWVQVLSLFSAVALYVNKDRHRDILGYVVATISAVALFFLALLLYSKNPFSTFLTEPPLEGKGLNPLLQNYWMVIHPPSLYTGFVGMTIPYAFCMAALASGRLDDKWLYSVRVWVLITWFFLTLGLILGGIWAYEELGWGGYWAWDPVENAGFLPWLTCTAFLHSVMIQERKGMLKMWNVVLMITSFFLTIFGTFMTRSGVVQSVHAFGQDNELALLFILFMTVLLVVSFGLVFYRLPQLRSQGTFDSLWSREFAFLLNNCLFLAAAFFVLFATMFPTLSEAIMNERITVGPPFFNKWMVPIGLALLFLAGAGPLLAWRATTRAKLFSQFVFPVLVAIAAVVAIAVLAPRARVRSAFLSDTFQMPVALLCFGLVAFTLAAVLQEFWRGVGVRRRQTGADPFTSLVGIILAKRRKYGGYIVHAGVSLMFLGFAGKAMTQDKEVTLEKVGESFSVGDYLLTYEALAEGGDDNKETVTATISVKSAGQLVTTSQPAKWHYLHGEEQTTTEVAIDRRLDKDIYVVLNGYDRRSGQINLHVFLNPLVNWVWLGFGLLAFGTAIALFPEALVNALRPRRRTRAGRMTEAAVVLLVLGTTTLGLVRLAQAQDMPPAPMHTEGPAPTMDNVSPVARRLFRDLVCLCGTCPREAIGTCPCGYAAKERDTVLGLIAGRDVSTKDKEDAVYRDVVNTFIAKYGGQHVLSMPIDKGFNRLAWAVPYGALTLALLLLVIIANRWVKRGRAAPAPGASLAPSGAPGATPSALYDEKLDDELRDLD